MQAPYFDFLCHGCGQFAVRGQDIARLPATEPLRCEPCRARDREPQGETVRLFEPAPDVMPGQTGFDEAAWTQAWKPYEA